MRLDHLLQAHAYTTSAQRLPLKRAQQQIRSEGLHVDGALVRDPNRSQVVGGGLQEVGAGIIAASGAAAYLTPKGNFKAYDMDVSEPTALAMMRLVGAWQLGAATVLARDTADVGAFSNWVAAAAILSTAPSWESIGAPKESMAIWIGILAALGKYGMDGKLNKWVPVALWLVNGAQFHFAPQFSADLYQAKSKISPMGLSMLSLSGGMMMVAGTYLGFLANGASQAEAFGYAYAVNGVLAAKWALTEAEGLGAPKHGPLAWAAISAGLAYKSLTA